MPSATPIAPATDGSAPPAVVSAALAALERERAARRAAEALAARLEAEKAEIAEQVRRLEHLNGELRKALFGKRSEKLGEDERQLSFDDLGTAVAEAGGAPEAGEPGEEAEARASFHLRPVVDCLARALKTSAKLGMDETTVRVLDPGRGRTKTGYMWTGWCATSGRGRARTLRASSIPMRRVVAASMARSFSRVFRGRCRSTATPGTTGCAGRTGRTGRWRSPPVGRARGAG